MPSGSQNDAPAGQPDAPAGPPPLRRADQPDRRNPDEALAYMYSVKERFRCNRAVYHDFMAVLNRYKKKRLDIPGLLARVKILFEGHEDLLRGFEVYLPAGYSLQGNGAGPRVVGNAPAERQPDAALAAEAAAALQPDHALAAEAAAELQPDHALAAEAAAELQPDDALAAKAAAEAERDAALAALVAAEAEREAALAAQRAAEREAAEQRDDFACTICFEAPREALFSPCMHLVCCGGCAARVMRKRPPKCPYCTQPIVEQLKVFCPA